MPLPPKGIAKPAPPKPKYIGNPFLTVTKTAKPAPAAVKAVASDLVERARLGDQNATGTIAAVRQEARKGNGRAKYAAAAIADYLKRNPQPAAGSAGGAAPAAAGGASTAAPAAQSSDSEYEEVDPSIEEALDEYVAEHPDAMVEDDPRESYFVGAEAAPHVDAVAKSGPVVAAPSMLKAAGSGQAAYRGLAGVLANGPYLTNERIHDIAVAIGSPQAMAVFLACVAGYKDRMKMAALKKSYPEAAPCILAGMAVGYAQHVQLVRQPGAPISKLSQRAANELGCK